MSFIGHTFHSHLLALPSPCPRDLLLLFLIAATASEALCQISRQVPWQALCLPWQPTMAAELEPEFLFLKKVYTCTEIVIKLGGEGGGRGEAVPSLVFCVDDFRLSTTLANLGILSGLQSMKWELWLVLLCRFPYLPKD